MSGDRRAASEHEREVHERRRAELVAAIPASYRPLLHLLFPSAFGVSAAVVSGLAMTRPTLAELAAIPITLLLGFGLEWRLHKSVLHQRRPGLSILYERHELTHHVVYRHDDMAIRSRRELLLILLPPYAIVVAFAGVVPLAGVVYAATSLNAALGFSMASMLFFLTYEWLHLAYHLPPTSWVGRRRALGALRELHTRHHDPALMKRWNFNVTIPVFDHLHGTLWSPERALARGARDGAAERPTRSEG